MATLGNSNKIIVGAAQMFVSTAGALEYVSGSGSAAVYNFGSGSVSTVPAFVAKMGNHSRRDFSWRIFVNASFAQTCQMRRVRGDAASRPQ